MKKDGAAFQKVGPKKKSARLAEYHDNLTEDQQRRGD